MKKSVSALSLFLFLLTLTFYISPQKAEAIRLQIHVWKENTSNNVFDDSADFPIGNVTVRIYNDTTGAQVLSAGTASSGSSCGNATWTVTAAGTYRIERVDDPGFSWTDRLSNPRFVTVTAAQVGQTGDIAVNFPVTGSYRGLLTSTSTDKLCGSIWGLVFIDTNNNDAIETTEAGYAGSGYLNLLGGQDPGLTFPISSGADRGIYTFRRPSTGSYQLSLVNVGSYDEPGPFNISRTTANTESIQNFPLVPQATNTPTPTRTPTPTITAKGLSFTLLLHGVGAAGDSANPAGPGNQNPQTTQKTLNVELYNTSNALVNQGSGTVSFDSVSGKFAGTVTMNTVVNGNYTVKIKTHKYLRRLIPGFISVTNQASYTIPQIEMIVGDIVDDNKLNILDYNVLIGCYSDIAPAVDCDQTRKFNSDLDDDGNVNQFDFNLFLRELSIQTGE